MMQSKPANTSTSGTRSTKLMSKQNNSNQYNGKTSGGGANSSPLVQRPAQTGSIGQQQQQQQQQPQQSAHNQGPPPPASAFLGQAAMMSIPQAYMSMSPSVAARLQASSAAAAAAACMTPYVNLRYPTNPFAAAAAAAASGASHYSAVPAPIVSAGYHHPSIPNSGPHHHHHPMSGQSVYQSSRVPASSPPVSSSAASASSQGGSTSSAVSSTSGLGSSASSTSTGLSNSLGGGNNGSSGGNNSGNGSSNSGLSADQLSRTNLYIRGLTQNTTDKDLLALCAPYGAIISTKAILDKNTNKCKGYGFVDFESPIAADNAVKALQTQGVQAQMAKCTDTRNKHAVVSASSANCSISSAVHSAVTNNITASTPNYSSSFASNKSQQEQDPTNLYIANLPPYMTETDLEAMLAPYGTVISTRILRDSNHQPRGVGFARMESKDKCDLIIQQLNGKILAGSKEPLLVKFADGGNKKKNQYKNQETRWRDGSDSSLAAAIAYAAGGDQSGGSHNGVTAAQLMPTMAGYHHHHQRSYSNPTSASTMSAAYQHAALQATATQWMHPAAAQYLVPGHAAHMQTAAQMIPSQTIDPNTALQFSALMPQMSHLQLSGASYMAGTPGAGYATANPTGATALYPQAHTPLIQTVALEAGGDGNNPGSGTSSVGPDTNELSQTPYHVYGQPK